MLANFRFWIRSEKKRGRESFLRLRLPKEASATLRACL